MTKDIKVNNLEIGRCYFTKMLNQAENKNIEKSFILEEIEPKFEKVESILLASEIQSKSDKNGYFRYQTKKPHYKIVIRESDSRRFNTIDNPNAFIYCLVEVPGEWKSINVNDLVTDNLKITKFNLIENSRLVKRYVENKPNKLEENQRYFKSGIWSAFKEVIIGSHDGPNEVQLIRKIQEKLIEEGFDLKANNILDEKTKKAIFKFQRENNLKEGQIDFETLKFLKIEGY